MNAKRAGWCWNRTRAIATLSGLSTEALNDIGITTGDVAVAASGRITLAELNEFRHSGWPY